MRVPRAAFAEEVAAGPGRRRRGARGPARQPGLPAGPARGRGRPLDRAHGAAAPARRDLAAREPVALDPDHLLGFTISSLVGVPLGVLCGAQASIARLTEPVIEFVRYLPAPAFGALMVAILGIYDGPKIAIIVIGTFFQQVLVIANTTRRGRSAAGRGRPHHGLAQPAPDPPGDRAGGAAADLPRPAHPARLGWTYLIVAELIGTSSGITFFITQQARYQHFDNVYAAILVIGLVGIATDIVLALIGRRLFPYARAEA
jgi:NitT/TauT family transport system permease protein